MKQALLALILALIAATAAAGQQDSINGMVMNANGIDPLQEFPTHLRNVATGELTGKTKTSVAGRFTFSDLRAGTYVVEVNNGKTLIGKSQPITVVQGQAPALPAIVQTNFAATRPLSGIGPWPYISLVASEGWEFDSTIRSLQRGGGREANPLFKDSNNKMFIYKGAVTAVLTLMMHQLDSYAQRRGSHAAKQAAKWLGYGVGIGSVAIAYHNEQVGR